MTYKIIHEENLEKFKGSRTRPLSPKDRRDFDTIHASAMRAMARRGLPPKDSQWARKQYKAQLYRDISLDVGDLISNVLPLLWPFIAPLLKAMINKIIELLMEKIDDIASNFSGNMQTRLEQLAEEAPPKSV